MREPLKRFRGKMLVEFEKRWATWKALPVCLTLAAATKQPRHDQQRLRGQGVYYRRYEVFSVHLFQRRD